MGIKKGGDLLSHRIAVPSAQTGLTSLFGMVRGEPRRYNHLKLWCTIARAMACPNRTRAVRATLGLSACGPRGGPPTVCVDILRKPHETPCNEVFALIERDGHTTSPRAISTTRLRTSLPFDLWPIDVVIFHGPLEKSHLVVGFALICFQRLSLPNVATLRCRWRDNRYTRGWSNPVLSY